MKGPPPKPTALKLLTGNPGKRSLNKSEPKPEPLDDLAVPPEIEKNENARVKWEELTPHLRELGLLTVVDRSSLAAFCMAFSRWVEFEKLSDEVSPGEAISRGYRKAALSAAQQMRAFATEFGFTPASRTRISTSSGGAAKSKFEDFRKRRGA